MKTTKNDMMFGRDLKRSGTDWATVAPTDWHVQAYTHTGKEREKEGGGR